MPEKGVKALAQSSQQRIFQTRFVDCHGQPANLPSPLPDLTAKPIGEELVPQTDAKDRHVGLQSLHNPLALRLEDRFLEFVGPVLATGEYHGVVASQVWDSFVQIYTDLGRQNPKSLEDVLYDKRSRWTVNEGDDL